MNKLYAFKSVWTGQVSTRGEVVEIWLDKTSSGGGVSFRVVKYTDPEEVNDPVSRIIYLVFQNNDPVFLFINLVFRNNDPVFLFINLVFRNNEKLYIKTSSELLNGIVNNFLITAMQRNNEFIRKQNCLPYRTLREILVDQPKVKRGRNWKYNWKLVDLLA